MGSKAPATQTNQTQVVLSPEQRELLDLSMPSLRQFAASPPRLPEGTQIAGFDPLQQQAQGEVLQAGQDYRSALAGARSALEGAAPAAQNVATQAAGTYGTLTSGDLLRPESNPALQEYMTSAINAGTAPIVDDLLQRALPAVRSGARMAGQYGGSRQGIAEGLAIQGAERQVGDVGARIASQIASQGYGQGLDAMTRGLGLTGAVQGAQVAPTDLFRTSADLARAGLEPATWTGAIGDVRQGMTQAQIDEAAQKFLYEEQLPLLVGKELASIVSGIPTGGMQTTGPAPRTSNPLMGGMGGALIGAQLANLLLPGSGLLIGGLGALAGGGLGALASR